MGVVQMGLCVGLSRSELGTDAQATAGTQCNDPNEGREEMTDQASSQPQPPDGRSPHPRTSSGQGKSLFTRASAAWVAVGSALVLLVLMIVFMLQNPKPTAFHFLGLTVTLPAGLATVIAAVGGGVAVAVAGTARIIQLRKHASRQEQPPQ